MEGGIISTLVCNLQVTGVIIHSIVIQSAAGRGSPQNITCLTRGQARLLPGLCVVRYVSANRTGGRWHPEICTCQRSLSGAAKPANLWVTVTADASVPSASRPTWLVLGGPGGIVTGPSAEREPIQSSETPFSPRLGGVPGSSAACGARGRRRAKKGRPRWWGRCGWPGGRGFRTLSSCDASGGCRNLQASRSTGRDTRIFPRWWGWS